MTVDTVCHSAIVGNTKTTIARGRGWCFTLNNYSDEEYENIVQYGHNNTEKFIVGKEVGAKGTPHLQGYMYFKHPQQFKRIKSINERAHWEKAKGNVDQNFKYCSKGGDFVSKGLEKQMSMQDIIKQEMLQEYESVTWRPWQQEILDIIKAGGSDRKINWVYDPIGNNGKSFLRRYICLTNEAVLADGKKDNIFNSFKVKCIDENKRVRLCVMDIPRQNEAFTNYGTIEAILDRHIYSGKYEGGEIWLDRMCVVVFANFAPKLENCTQDRWNIIKIKERPPASVGDGEFEFFD